LLVYSVVLQTGAFAFSKVEQSRNIRLYQIQSAEDFADSIEPNALRLACASNPALLTNFFKEKNLPFKTTLVRHEEDEVCHIFYEPTIPGFRADPDDLPLSELYIDLDTLGYLSKRNRDIGDSIDIAKQLLEHVRRPITVNLGVSRSHDESWYSLAKDFHFPGSIHTIRHRESKSEISNPWVQDYFKSGRVDDFRKILVTRLLFEGDRELGEEIRATLSTFSGEPFVRSKLSWDGGDLQFVKSPADPAKLLLFHGGGARLYWGNELSSEEYAYILKLEFGADILLDFSDQISHVDYFLTFLPEDKIALVSQPVTNNLALAQDAIRFLSNSFPDSEAWKMAVLNRIPSMSEAEFRLQADSIREAIKKAHKASWKRKENESLRSRLQSYVLANCPQNSQDCLNVEGQGRLLNQDPSLLADWIEEAFEVSNFEHLPGRLLTVVESQLPGFKASKPAKLEEKVKKLKELGFKVLFSPRIAGDPKMRPAWAGISYSNGLLVDRDFFVPVLGIGSSESAIIEKFQQSLPESYRVLPVFALRNLLYNGGIHCSVGIVRAQDLVEQKTDITD
jgi:hypothetical protein